MNIKVITRHGPSNYGSLLQSIATLKLLNRLGVDAEIIDYQRDDERGLKAVLANVNHKEGYSNPLKKFLYVAVRFPMEWRAQHKFDGMRKKYLKMTKRCENTRDLENLRADIFMTGSDQVWGPVLTDAYDKNYFLDFVDEDTKKVAYAASFGKTEFVDTTVAAYKRMLVRYSNISVRENSAQELLRKWNIPCAGQVLDPTMLLTGEEWSKFIKKNRPSGYVLVYQLHNNVQLSSYAKSFAKEVNLPLYRVSPSLHQFCRGGKFIYLPDLGDFLSAIKNCSYLITDSFHGTCFAINFNRQFIEILPNNNTGARNQSILQLTGLIDRIVSDYTDFSIKDRVIDYSKVNEIIQTERIKSIDILKNMMNKDCDSE